jgi:hypothetical protein
MPISELLQPQILLCAPLIVFMGYVVYGLTGFGSTLITMPLLAHFLPIQFVVPFVVMIECVAAFSMGIQLRLEGMRSEILPLLPFIAIGTLSGVYVLVYIPAELLMGSLGILVLVFGGYYLIFRGQGIRVPRWVSAPIGLCAGAVSATFGIGGPIYVFYLNGRGANPDQIRATMPMLFMFTTVPRIILFAIAGLYSPASVLAAVALLPFMVLGLRTGSRLHLNLSREHIIRIIGCILILTGTSLLMRASH